MRISREVVGITTGHAQQAPTEVHAYTLDTAAGFAITVWTYGATLVEAIVPDREGRCRNVVLRLPDLKSYEDRSRNPYLGATLGRFARSVARGRFVLDGREYRLSCNIDGHHLHGGEIAFDRFVWEAHAEQTSDELSLHLRLERPDGDEGYPGAVSAETIYRIARDGRLTFGHNATATAPTILAMTNHAYWNLAGEGTIDDHWLAIHSHRVLLVGEDGMPVGDPAEVAGTRFGYLQPKRIGAARLDNSFVLDHQEWAAELFDPLSGRAMRVTTDQSGLQLYSADHFTSPRAGLCIQTGAWPNAPNRPDYPSARLDPGVVYRHRTVHQFSVR